MCLCKDTSPSIMEAFNVEALKLSLMGVTIITSSGDNGVAGMTLDSV